MEVITKRLREVMERKGLTSYRLARDIRVAPSTLTQILAGRSMPRVDTLRMLSLYLNVSVDWLLGLTNKEKI